MTSQKRDRITLRGAPGLFAAVPVMLGFRPTDSLVMVCLHGPGAALGEVARVDLDSGPDTADRLVEFADRQADAVAVVCYGPAGRRPPLLDLVLDGLYLAGVPIAGVWWVDRDRAWDAMTADRPSFPAEDDGDPDVLHLRATQALAGRAVLPSRSHLIASIRPAAGVEQDALAVLAHVAGEPAPDADRVASRALAECERAGAVQPRTAARLARAIADRRARDDLIVRALRQTDRCWVATLVSVAAHLPDRPAAPVCAVLSVIAYRTGDGALAQVAAQRCLMFDPDHGLGRMMTEVMARGLPPDRLAELIDPPDGQAQRASSSTGASTSATESRCTSAADGSTPTAAPLTGSSET